MIKKKDEELNPTGSGDIFRDLGFSEHESVALNIKACFFRKLQTALRDSNCTQLELATKLRLPQPKVSDIINGKMAGFSVERIVKLLLRMNYVVGLDARPAPAGTRGCVIDLTEKLDQVVLQENNLR